MDKLKLAELYRKNFSFTKEDQPVVEKRNAKYLYIILPALFVFALIFEAIIFIEWKKTGELSKYKVFYYSIMMAVSLVNFIFNAVMHKCKNIAYSIKVIPVYITTITFFFLCYYNTFFSARFYNGFMFFCIESVILVLIFEFNPVIWTVIVAAIMTAIGTVVLKSEEPTLMVNMTIFACLVVILGFWKRYHSVLDLRQKRELAIANKKSEDLLLNILPKKVMEQLRDSGSSEPEEYKNVSILFTDIVNFTESSKDLSPEVLIHELNDIFSHFDRIVEKYGCTRIKTIGDAYLAVCGLPEENPKHAEMLMHCAQEFVEFLEGRNKTSEHKWQMRIGIHTGNVVAGIVGIRKYIYDIFGDAVNTASRMESMSESMKINVSEDVFNELKDQFHFQKREIMDVKGKGKMQMYFAE